MSNTQLLRRRIKSISNTRQITKAMELVSAAKMRKAQEQTVNSRLYSENADQILKLLSVYANKYSHPLLDDRPNPKKGLVIIITSDKGLAGSYNSFAIRQALKFIDESKISKDILTVGKKAQDFFTKTPQNIIATFTTLPPNPSINDIQPIIEIAIGDYLDKKNDLVTIIYTKFHSTIKQVAVTEQLLPIVKIQNEEVEPKAYEYKFEPNPAEVMNVIVPKLVEISLYQKLLESIASEHSARMVAMKNASDNAKDIIYDLQLTYNSVRQASITSELAEITAGANAIN